MKNLRSQFQMTAENHSTDGIVSHMLMGFVERKISPQTIADVLRAQIFESHVPAHLLNIATCNGILEAVTQANSTEDCSDLVFYLSSHPQFPEFLSFKAASGSLRALLRYLQKNMSQELLGNIRIDSIIELLSERILSFFHARKPVDLDDKANLTILIKTTNPTLAKLMRNSPHFQHLRFMLMSPNDYMNETSVASVRPQPLEMLNIILKTADDHLLRNGTSYYKTEPTSQGTSGRIKHFNTAMDILKSTQASDFKTGFIVEWLFDKALVEAILHEENHTSYIKLIKLISINMGSQLHILRGLIKAIQKDFSFLASHPMQKIQEYKPSLLERALILAQNIFPSIVTLAEKDNNYTSKYIANWAIEIPIQNEESRFFKRIHWRWIRTLAAHIWDASLREPPNWVIEGGSQYCATIFQTAPAQWLQEHSFRLLEKVYQETLVENFEPAQQHYDYVEFIARSMRKKSPFFASRTESLYALHLLSRLTRTEAMQYASAEARFQSQLANSHNNLEISAEFAMWKEIILNPNIEENLGNNPITRALAVLARLAKETSKK
ncbi:hypothetical protein [Fluviispira sanaruensis]|uniref:Uncharacterized protein n=1 Tax=Fluviispira sanaruensis TaxID=2493639 RepID=A0A4P2VMQ4_FLUSA|nr:hypothetical protein [Fluviispira sanaruensis]BBH53334.1 hypothetical protein JCM31447_17770 [Fluviispira sanaruensis]